MIVVFNSPIFFFTLHQRQGLDLNQHRHTNNVPCYLFAATYERLRLRTLPCHQLLLLLLSNSFSSIDIVHFKSCIVQSCKSGIKILTFAILCHQLLVWLVFYIFNLELVCVFAPFPFVISFQELAAVVVKHYLHHSQVFRDIET